MFTDAQLRAARGLLDWTRADLAKAAGVSPETIKNIEHGTFKPQEATADAIERAFAVHDVKFLDGEGVKISKELVKVFVGKQGFIDKINHVYNVVCKGPAITKHLALSDNYAQDVAPEAVNPYKEKMGNISKLDARCLIWENDYNFPFDYCQYRWLKRSQHSMIAPFYLYGNYASFMVSSDPESFTTVSIYSEFLTAHLSKQFDHLWEEATIPKRRQL